MHQNIIRWFGAFNAGPDFAVQLLRDYTLYHNQVGHINRTGKAYAGSYDIDFPPNFGPQGGWVNGSNYIHSEEVFGILPIPSDMREHLASQQNTLNAVVPVHTKAERGLFKLLVSHLAIAEKHQPNWETMAVQWSSHTDGKTIFYKVSNRADSNSN